MPAADSDVLRLRLERAEALRELATLRLDEPERLRILSELDAAIDRAHGTGLLPAPTGQTDSARAMTIAEAEQKVKQAEADREEKRRPYEADPLFMYLWRRGYGTRSYRANRFARYFDRKVAHLIGFETARINYVMLMQLPIRLREHVDRLKEEASDQGLSLRLLEEVEQKPELRDLLQGPAPEPDSQAARLIEHIHAIDQELSERS
ncbi:hypothetical protein [Microvirga massiliensis]|uniref:hypothetical protein n=1 Tax=Microvirga massiliensis TaxID=1033741 RepID=UPI0006602E65|nr:hypothetical protein [Microvirga massiliensis]